MIRVWIDGPKFCNYVEDDERVLGQVVAVYGTSKWRAFDTTKLNSSKTAALPIGSFETIELAKAEIEHLHGV